MFTYLVLWVQVLSEMLPISSSTQVSLLERLYEACGYVVAVVPKGFDYLLHVPLLIVLPLFFRRSWLPSCSLLVKRLWCGSRVYSWSTRQLIRIMSTVAAAVVVSCLLTVLVDYALAGVALAAWLRPIGLVVTAVMLIVGGRVVLCRSEPAQLLPLLFVGITQALAMFPGISRMGITISTALICGLSVRRAFEFSFALELPLVTAAVLFRGLPWLMSEQATAWCSGALFVHLLCAGMVSYGLLWCAMKLFEQGRAWIFSCYVLLCAVLLWL